MMNHSEYIPTIGIETHVQLKTKTKLFAAVGNDAKDAAPNSLISHICVGLPGALPVLNEKALELACRAGFALNTKPEKFSKFDRKHYFYPDLPKGYQITQYDQPIILDGYVEIEVNDQKKRINITRIHLEEDAGKNTHPAGADYSLIDLNRAGTPLLEIVSEPEISSPAQAKAYARELYLLMKYAEVSDCDLYLGHMRFDVNISLSKDPKQLGIRSEVKNLNSFRSVENAVAYEIKRQTEILNNGEKVVQQTRGWDEAKQKTTSQRGKEEAHDYRYMPEPDIPPIELDEAFIEVVRKKMPLLPNGVRQQLASIGVGQRETETILDDCDFASKIMELINTGEDSRAINYLVHTFLRDTKLRDAFKNIASDRRKNMLRSSMAAANATTSQQINSSQFDKIITGIVLDDKNIEDFELLQISDEDSLEKIVAEVLALNQKATEDVKKGELKAIGFLVGQVMAKSKGQANPGVAQNLIKKQLGL